MSPMARAGGLVAVATRLVSAAMFTVMLTDCGLSSSEPNAGADSVGRGRSCQIHESSRTNTAGEVAEVRESVCETDAEFLAPDVASIFIFVHRRSVGKAPGNVAMRYEVVCPDTGDCIFPLPQVTWLNRSSLLIALRALGDAYCIKRTTIDNISIVYPETPLREPPQDAFTTAQRLCE